MALPARLTIYCATQDLKLESWDGAGPVGSTSTQVEHPVLEHANAIFMPDRDYTKAPAKISGVRPTCYKVKTSRYRGVAYMDPDGQVWVVSAGIRKGMDRDDFYQRFMRRSEIDPQWWLPTSADRALLEREKKTDRLLAWRRHLFDQTQSAMAYFSHEVYDGGCVDPVVSVKLNEISQFLDFSSLNTSLPAVTMRLISLGEEEYLGVELQLEQHYDERTRSLCQLGIETIAAAIHDGEQDWSKDGLTEMGQPQFVLEFGGEITLDSVLRGIRSAKPPAWFRPGGVHHLVAEEIAQSHVRTVSDAIVQGSPVFALCGTVFVPRQDHKKLAACARCMRIQGLLEQSESK
ncbi:DUF3039 domain-containing protein [Corynebacterium gottingense]|uniref:DUF3039 domain-containing protein n=1 Tax=Corynebacterium gottingense TaxID=2041036 RepID=UPI0038CFAAB8